MGGGFSIPPFTIMHENEIAGVNIDVVVVLTEAEAVPTIMVALAPTANISLLLKPMALTADDTRCRGSCLRQSVRSYSSSNRTASMFPVLKLRQALEAGRFGKDWFWGTVRVRWCRHQTYYDQDPWRGTLGS